MEAKNIQDIYTLSPTQQGILFHILSAPDSGIYLEQTLCTLHGNLHVSTFEQAWQQVVDRHPSLRTGFIWQDLDQPVQVVYRQVQFEIEQYDWCEQSNIEQKEQLQVYLQADRKRGFQLSVPPLMRLTLIRITERTYQFIWSSYHLVLDAWSLKILLKEFFCCYEALCKGDHVKLTPSPAYRDYITWLKQQDLSKAEAFWRKILQGWRSPTLLPVDSLTNIQGFGKESIVLSSATTTALKSLAKQHHLTVNTLILGAWSLLLSHYSGEKDVLFGLVVSGRPTNLAGVESMVGLFINTLPIRVQVSWSDLLLPWLKQLQSQQINLRQYEYSPLVQVQSWSDVPKGSPLFESIVVFQNAVVDVCDLSITNFQVDHIQSLANSNYPLGLVVVPGSQLQLELRYDMSRFQAAVVTNILGHIQTILNSMVANLIDSNPNRLIGNLEILTNTERQKLLVEFNNTKKEYSQNLCIHQLIEQQVKRQPDNFAVVFADQRLTYRELNARANQLARYLHEIVGVGQETLVGICVERSVEMLVGVLAILKAGGAYLPLDPVYPPERLNFMLEDSQVKVLLTQEKLVKILPKNHAQVICLDTDWSRISQESTDNLMSKVQPENLAYVIYTSGSTGKPKGVLIAHQGLCNLAQTQIATFNVSYTSRVLQFASLSFDASISEVVMALCSGAELYLVTSFSLLVGTNLLQFLQERAITHITLPPTVLATLPTEEIPTLQTIVVAGETCSIELATTWSQGRCFYNAYGPTEYTVCATINKYNQGDTKLHIGRPIANTQIYLLDSDRQPVAMGVVGELYIGGVGLARGYLNRPELTAQKFIPNYFSNEPGSRLYKTGDLARYLNDGNIEFIGRIDHQIKLRGFRIELEEIAIVLKQYSLVQEAVVIACEETAGDVRLVAYLKLRSPTELTISDLRHFLKAKLPSYMIPAAFVEMESIPLTANGKIDRLALPQPDHNLFDTAKNYVPPHTSTEKVIADIWAKVLQLEKVSIYDNFFDLGGNSVLTIPVCSQIQETLNPDISLVDLFTYPTVSALARYLAKNQKVQQPGFTHHSRASKKTAAMKMQKQQRRNKNDSK
jgi:amino acid adenylation domain-containing protein